ncbi:MAG: hypothetical protein KDE35_18360 [Geminicoccaceae bacterium]|nr:hypothetical protein [Geminicoccaceae bacterium]
MDARGGSERERGDWRVSLARSVGVRPIAEPPAGVAFGFDIDPQRLFEEPRPRLRRDTGLLLGRIARALASAGEGEVDRLQIMLNVRADRLGDLGEAALLTRLELLRRRLLELGAPVEAVEVGWTTAADDFWRLGFWAAPDGER